MSFAAHADHARAHHARDVRAHLAAYEHAWQQHLLRPTEQTLLRLAARTDMLYVQLYQPGRFDLGAAAMTPGARDALADADQIPPEFLLRHKHGDWGDLDEEDAAANEDALRFGGRLLSTYGTRLGAKLWVNTERDRSVTRLLLPAEY